MYNAWLFYAIGCSFFNALHGVIIKMLTKKLSSWFLVWAMNVFALPFIALSIAFFGIPQADLPSKFNNVKKNCLTRG